MKNDFTDDFPIYYSILEGNIAYLYIKGEPGDKKVDKIMPEAIKHFQGTKGLIMDIRQNSGGEDRGAQAFASYFTDQDRLFMTTSIKNGPGPDDFTSPDDWFISPKGQTYDGPILLLTNRGTVSAGETLGLAMRTLPQVTSMGDTTTGAFANAISRELPNGWVYSISIGDWRDAAGKSHEGIGLAPDILIQNKMEDLLQGTDEVLEAAIDFFK